MSKFWAAAGVSVLALLAGQAAVQSASGAAAAQAEGAKVDNFRLTSADQQSYELYRMADARAVVIVSHVSGDPALARMASALKAMRSEFGAQGVEFLLLNSKLGETREAMIADAARLDVGMPILMDANQLAGEQLGVTRAGEVMVIDPKTWRLVHRGSAASAAGAVAALVSGRAPEFASVQGQGAVIAFPERDRRGQHAQISYARTIAPLIEEKCVVCHQEGGIGPMQLTSYERIRGFAPMIRETIRTKRMPPFHAEGARAFHDDQSLSGEQVRTLVHWIEAGAPRGEGADPLAGKTYAAAEWPLGTPDLILEVPEYTIPATGVVQYQRPFTPYPATEGKWLRAATFKVDQRQAVHHILTGYIANPPTSGNRASESLWGATLGTYAVGTEWAEAPADVGTYLPAGGAIGFQNHYTPFGREVTDRTKIGLYYYDSPPRYIMRSNTIIDPTIQIAPNTERHVENAYLVFPRDALLYGAFIHAHYRGSGSTLEILYPDGKREMLISVPRYDFNWQRDYRFKDPVRVPAGSKLIATYVYDNSARNPANPDPSRMTPWGEQSWDEMLYTTLSYRWMDETSDRPTNYDELLLASRRLGMFDANLNDKVELDELKGATGLALRAAFATLDRNGDGGLDATEIAAMGGGALLGGRNTER